jgi:NAD(P)-dependent dehydrogenase (short-subunit alcohol dehydrogenase family)
MSAFYKLLRSSRWNAPSDPQDSFAGKTVLVTGSNTGLGYEAAYKFAALGASHLILAVRDVQKGEVAKTRLEERLGPMSKTCLLKVWPLDLSDYDSVKSFAQRVESELEQLDVAVLNAGVFNIQFGQSKYQWENDLQVNTLSTTLLALLLLPKLKETARTTGRTPTLELVSSGTHYMSKLTPEQMSGDVDLLSEFNQSSKFSTNKQYGLSKLFLMYALEALSELAAAATDGTPVVFVTSTCPGMCTTEIARGFDSLLYRIGKAIIGLLLFRTAEQGSRTLVSGALLGSRGHGVFWQNDIIRE